MQQQPAWILDLVVKYGDARKPIPTLSNSIWFVISVDGASEPFSTSISCVSMHPVWEYPSRTLLKLDELQTAYMYFTLCTYGPDQGVIALARSRVSLKYFPCGTPKQFTFPLMSANNSAEELMSLTLLGIISQIPPNFSPNGQNENQYQSHDSLFDSNNSTFGSNFSTFNSAFGTNSTEF